MSPIHLPIAVAAFYKFVHLHEEELAHIVAKVEGYGQLWGIRGLILFAEEGCNGTVAGTPESLQTFKALLTALPEFQDLVFKDSRAAKWPFRRFAVQRRQEIVTFKNHASIPAVNSRNRLSPAEWDETLKREGDKIVLIDVRNDYETRLGMFKGARDPGLKRFSEFPGYLETAEIPTDSKVLMYCTGGIRCEKAIEEMYDRGFTEVFQLDGGILAYLEQFPNSQFDGECFVFDHRVAVNQDLLPSQQFGLCPHCGDPSTEVISCAVCEAETRVCERCSRLERGETCSKNCAYHHVGRRGLSPDGKTGSAGQS